MAKMNGHGPRTTARQWRYRGTQKSSIGDHLGRLFTDAHKNLATGGRRPPALPAATGSVARLERIAHQLHHQPQLPLSQQRLDRANNPLPSTDRDPLTHLERPLDV